MLPDSTDIIIFSLAFAAQLAAAYFAGDMVSKSDDGESTALGFTNEAAGACALSLILCGFLAFFGALAMNALGLWLILIYAALFILSVLLFSLGFCSEGKKNRFKAFFSGLGYIIMLPARLIFKAAGISANQSVTEEEVLSLVDDVEEQELIDESQKEMITNIFELDDVTAFDIMTHRTELVSVEEQTPLSEAVRLAMDKGFSRMPVYKKTLDNVSGIVYAKDLLRLINEADALSEPVIKYTRSAMFVPEGRRARDLLIDFKHKRTQVAVVVDEYGGTAGLVSMEDILEEIVGNIQDEYDNEDELLIPAADGFIADGSLDLDEVFDAFGLQMPEAPESEFDSVGGLITDTLGRIPTQGEDISVSYCGIKFNVLEVGERRILKVKCTLDEEQSGEAEDFTGE